MCGITAVAGRGDIVPTLYESIKNLEYRGYDSCGIGIIQGQELLVKKNTGGVAEVADKENFSSLHAPIGIAHTRWATHGQVNKENAHPHTSNDNLFTLVHNGIINNYQEIKVDLSAQGIQCVTETDTEVLSHLMSVAYTEFKDVEQAFLAALNRMEGYYAICMITPLAPDTIFCARDGSPLVIGLSGGKNYVASDVNAFLPYTRDSLMMEDGEYALVTSGQASIFKMEDRKSVSRAPIRIEWDAETSRKGGYSHFMLKEIFEQPQTIKNALITPAVEIEAMANAILGANRTYLMGIGTTYYVALTGQFLFRQYAGVFLPAISSDEFTDLAEIKSDDLLFSISQSGETFDTLMAVKYAQEQGAKTASIVNVMGSSLSRKTDLVIHQGSGPEICVVSTKAALAQMIILQRIAIEMGRINGFLPQEKYEEMTKALETFPDVVSRSLNELSGFVRNLSRDMVHFQNWLFLGRGIYHAIALEAALKMKEITYLHVEGMGAGFLKHGTLSMVDQDLVSLFFIPPKEEKELNQQTLNAVEQVKSRGGPALGILFEGDQRGKDLVDHYIELPKTHASVAPLLSLMVAQLFAYFSALKLGRSIDKPRNLAKSVTVG